MGAQSKDSTGAVTVPDQGSRELLLEMFCPREVLVGGRQKSQRTLKGSFSSLEFAVSPWMAEEKGRRKQIHGKNSINHSASLDHSPFLHKNIVTC